MKKTIVAFFVATIVSSAAFADNLIGIRLGYGELNGTAKEDLGESTKSIDKSESSEFGSIFIEGKLPLESLPFELNIGLDYIPLTAHLQSNDGHDANSTISADVDNHLSIYLSPRKNVGNDMTVFGKIGYSQADITKLGTTLNAGTITGDNELTGWTVGLGIEKSLDLGYLDFIRAEIQYTEYDSLAYTDTKTGLTTKNHTADLDTTTITIGFGKKF